MLLPDEIRENRNVFRAFLNYSLWAFLFILLLFLYISQSISVSDSKYHLKRMEMELSELQKEKIKLETEISFLSSPERIGGIAEKELKLNLVRQEDIIWIDDTASRDKDQMHVSQLQKREEKALIKD
ncbi:MAG: hypothetical protein PHF84_05995 [bacterium]|nr:hypothetical protein [bacterium]